MATTLAAQLTQIAAKSTNSLNLKAQKTAHAHSLIFEPSVAATQDFDGLYTICAEGFQELCLLDHRFATFQRSLFSEQSKSEDRTQMTQKENTELDHVLEDFLGLVGARLLLKPGVKAVEWLVRRFRIHEYNISFMLLTFLPYHTAPIFYTLMSILPRTIPDHFNFLRPYIRSLTNPARHSIVYNTINTHALASALNSYVLRVSRLGHHHHALLAFWSGVMTEAVAGMMDQARSGRGSVQRQNEGDALLRILPTLSEGLAMKKVPDLRIGCYMVLIVLTTKASLEERVLTGMMEAVVSGWTKDSLAPALTCVAILGQARHAVRLPKAIVREMLKLDDLVGHLRALRDRYRVDRLTLGLLLGVSDGLAKSISAKDLAFVEGALTADILNEAQTEAALKSLLVAAQSLGDGSEDFRGIGRLAELLGRLSSSPVLESSFRKAVDDDSVDMDLLEMKLQTVIQPSGEPKQIQLPEDVEMEGVEAPVALKESFETVAANLPTRTADEVSFLSASKSHIFGSLARAFVVAAASPEHVQAFVDLPILRRETALQETLFLSFFIRIWSGPYPVLARSAALGVVARNLATSETSTTNLQALLPYIIAALSDPARRVRSAAADLMVVIFGSQAEGKTSKADLHFWGKDGLYGREQNTTDVKWLSDEHTKLLTGKILFPALEECVLDSNHVGQVVQNALRSSPTGTGKPKDTAPSLKNAQRTALMSFLSSHVIHTPIYLVKLRLLKILNRVSKVSGTSRSSFLLPLLQDQASVKTADLQERAKTEQMSIDEVEQEAVNVVTSSSRDGLKTLQDIVSGKLGSRRPTLVKCALQRLQKLWPSLKAGSHLPLARFLLDLSLDRKSDVDTPSTLQGEALDTLRSLQLPTEVLVNFVEQLQTVHAPGTLPSASKRRKGNNAGPISTSPQTRSAITAVTLILELVDSSNAETHPELLRRLFQTLGEIQRLKTQVGSELAYLQSLALGSLLAIVRGLKDSTATKIDRTAVKVDLLTDCIRSTGSPQVQNAALLLVASLADVAPELVLHSVMPIFTFMGTTVLRHDDEYSVHVIDQTIRQVVPALVSSLRKQNQDPVAGTAELLLSFVAAFEHIPAPRRLKLFTSLIQTLGEEEFLFALLAMLTDKYPDESKIEAFTVELASQFGPQTQLMTVRRGLDLVVDVLKPKRAISESLLSIGGTEDDGPDVVAMDMLALLDRILSNEKLVSSVGRIARRDDMESARLHDTFTSLLEEVLSFADSVTQRPALHAACGEVLQSLLGLLTTSEFIKSVETLLGRTPDSLRRSILNALEGRIRRERVGDQAARTAVLTFLPQITSIIETSSSVHLQHTAIACVDQILEKYGKKDPEAVSAAAKIVVGPNGLLHDDDRLRVMALLCLASCAEILGANIVPILPQALPAALAYLGESIEQGMRGEKMHNAVFAFVGGLLIHVPWMITGQYLDRILDLAHRSAQSELVESDDESALEVLRLLPKRLDVKECLAAVNRTWGRAVNLGPIAIKGQLEVLGTCVELQPKSAIVKNATILGEIFRKGLDLRRTVVLEETDNYDDEDIRDVEGALNQVMVQTILKMNDTTFRPIFSKLIGRATARSPKEDRRARTLRLTSMYGFLFDFFEALKSIVTSYGSYMIETAVENLDKVVVKDKESRALWTIVARTLAKAFEHDQDDFWQAPAHFAAIAPPLLSQFIRASTLPVVEEIIPAVTELAATVDSSEQQKEINSAILMHFRSDDAAVRLAAVKCEEALTDRLGADWLSLLPEMLPFISELQEDDDEDVERETHRWIVKIEGMLGESLDSMLQ